VKSGLRNLQPDISAGVGDLGCLGLEAGRERRNGQRTDFGSIVRVGVDLLAGEGVAWRVSAISLTSLQVSSSIPDALDPEPAVVVVPPALLVVVLALVETFVVVADEVVLPVVVVALVVVTRVVEAAPPGWH
jgi:hypothetical protein